MGLATSLNKLVGAFVQAPSSNPFKQGIVITYVSLFNAVCVTNKTITLLRVYANNLTLSGIYNTMSQTTKNMLLSIAIFPVQIRLNNVSKSEKKQLFHAN